MFPSLHGIVSQGGVVLPPLNYTQQFDFSRSSTLWKDINRTVPVTTINDPIQGVTDISGSGNHGQQSVTTKSPSYIPNVQNGLSVARLDGVDDFLNSSVSAAANARLFYIVFIPNSTTGNRWIFDAQTGRFIIAHSNSTIPGNTGFFDGAWNGVAANQNGLQTAFFNMASPTATFYRNGVSIGTNAYTALAIGGTIAHFSSYFGINFLSGDVCEWGIVEGAVTAQNITDLQTALKAKWGTP